MTDPQSTAGVLTRTAPTTNIVTLAWLIGEHALLFYLLPTLYYLDIVKLPLIPYLCAMALITTIYLLRAPTFDRAQFWNYTAAIKGLPTIFIAFVCNAIAITALVYFLIPERFLEIPRRSLGLWAFIMLLYPLFSVYPQEIIYRVFMFERYRPLFGSNAIMIAASAAAFGFGHIIFGNWIAVPMTLIGGILFAITYARSKSTLLVAIEHALYGDLVFTIGLGSYFYAGG